MCLFVELWCVVQVVCGFLQAINSGFEQKLWTCSGTQRFPCWSRHAHLLWIVLKHTDQKVSRFIYTTSHKENCLKTWEKKVRSCVCFWDFMGLTNVTRFNGVEQCEKCACSAASKVNHTAFVWMSGYGCLSVWGCLWVLGFWTLIPYSHFYLLFCSKACSYWSAILFTKLIKH